MSKTKTKIRWTIAVLLALSFVAGMVLHNHYEPQIIGDLSKEDVSAISKIMLGSEREGFRTIAKFEWKQREFSQLRRTIRDYALSRITFIEASTDKEVYAFVGPEGNFFARNCRLVKSADGWRIEPVELMQFISSSITNTAPASNPTGGR